MSAAAVLAQRQELFVRSYLPVIADRFKFRFRNLAPEARAEATQDATALAWQSFSRAAEAGTTWDGVATDRTGCATPTRIAEFAAGHQVAGRGFLGVCVTDPLSPACQQLGRAALQRLHGSRLGDEPCDLVPAALVTRAHADPASRARAQVDWRMIAARCSLRARQVLALLVRGWKPSEIARRLGVSPGRVTQIKSEIAAAATALGYGLA